MLAAIMSAILMLLLVLVFILLLHFYARCFVTHGPDAAPAPVAPLVLGARLYHLRNFFAAPTADQNPYPPMKGLRSSVISTIPQFVFKAEAEEGHGLECVICLSVFGDHELGRKLSVCDHAFHAECIDMWLHSHTTCPICRAPAVQPSALDYRVSVVIDSAPGLQLTRNQPSERGQSSGSLSTLM